MTWLRIFLIFLGIAANVLIITYDLMFREESLIRQLKLHKIFLPQKPSDPEDIEFEDENITDHLHTEVFRVINELRRQFNASGSRWKHSHHRKVVLQYTAVFDRKPWPWMENTDQFNHWMGVECPYYSCELVYDRKDRPRSDALLFHSRDMPAISLMDYILKEKKTHERWVFFSKENPMNNPPSKRYDFYFNWTMTYKQESDIFISYGYYFPVKRKKKIPESVFLKNKKKLVVWTSSHCNLPRDDYVRELLKYIHVDVVGACANAVFQEGLDCPQNNKACNEKLKTYKFHLAFENTNCLDYITEKYWRALRDGVVPVVMGGSDYGSTVAIPGSFINVADFSTVKALADYLVYLDKNDTAYKEYFRWRQKYMTVHYSPWNCILCARLHLDTTTKLYKTMDTFWGAAENCGSTSTDKKLYKMLHQRQRTSSSEKKEIVNSTGNSDHVTAKNLSVV